MIIMELKVLESTETKHKQMYSDEELLNFLRNISKKSDNIYTTFMKEKNRPSITTYKERFGSWKNSLKLAKIDKQSLIMNIENKNINKNFKDYIDGLMLGDGHIRIPVGVFSNYSQVCIEIEWLNEIRDFFKKYKINTRIFKDNRDNKNYILETYTNKNFNWFRKRWYNEDILFSEHPLKIIPQDLELTSITLSNWYMGDGNLHKKKEGRDSWILSIATTSYCKNDVIKLMNMLNDKTDCKIHMTHSNNYDDVYGWNLQITCKNGIYNFLKYIKGYVNSCYSHKISPFLDNHY